LTGSAWPEFHLGECNRPCPIEPGEVAEYSQQNLTRIALAPILLEFRRVVVCLHLASLTKGSSYSCFWAWARLVENAFHPQADKPFGTFWIRQDIKPSVFDGLDYSGANLLRFHAQLLDARVEIPSPRC
jgi:hypothetical protein